MMHLPSFWQILAIFLVIACRQSCAWIAPSVTSSTIQSCTRLRSAADTSGQSLPPPRMLNRPIRRRPSTTESATNEESKDHAAKRHAAALEDPTLLSNTSFDDIGVAPSIVRSLNEMGLKQLTEIQARCYAPAVDGQNIVGQSRTGSGKTLAFLLPIVSRMIAQQYRTRVLIVAPTRELALQIASEAKRLCQYDQSIDVVSVHGGGGGIGRECTMLRRRKPSILVATPGRLLDILESKVAIAADILVLDEFDRLVGSPELKKALTFLPRASKRQTIMMSATAPRNDSFKAFFGSEGFNSIGSSSAEHGFDVNHRVDDYTALLPTVESYLTFLVSILDQEKDKKVIVFLPTNKLVKFVFECFRANRRKQCWSIHSHMSNGSRQRASASFNESQQRGILLTSDVSARGLDYPDVDLVVQYGLASNRGLYLHRKGRTARAGKTGRNLVVGMPFEASGLNKLSSQARPYDVEEAVTTVQFECTIRKLVLSGNPVLKEAAESAAKSFAAYYLAQPSLSSQMLKDTASGLGHAFGLPDTWQLPDDFDLKRPSFNPRR